MAARQKPPTVKLTVPQTQRMVEATRWFEAHGRNQGIEGYGGRAILDDFWIEVTSITVSSGISYLSWKHKQRMANGTVPWRDHPDGIVSSASAPDTRAICNDTTIAFTTGSILRAIVEVGSNSVATYTINIADSRFVNWKITSAASGGGKYIARTVTGQSTATSSGNLSMPEGLTVAGADNILLLNAAEDGLSSHALVTGLFGSGEIVGNDTTGKMIVVSNIAAAGGTQLLSAKTATGDARTTAGDFTSVTASIAPYLSSVGTVLRLRASFVTSNVGSSSGAILQAAFSGGGQIGVNFQMAPWLGGFSTSQAGILEITITVIAANSANVSMQWVSQNNLGGVSSTNPTCTNIYAADTISISATTTIKITLASNAPGVAVTLVELTLEKLK